MNSDTTMISMAIAQLSEWKEFGLAGIVIGALFVILGVIVRWLVAHIDKQATEHRTERSEWRTSSEAQLARSDEMAREFTSTLRGLGDGQNRRGA